jgi:ribosome biogenesis GTPase
MVKAAERNKRARMNLQNLGWNDAWQQAFESHASRRLVPGRVLVEHRGRYEVATETSEHRAETAGSLYNTATMRSDLPSVGDFVALRMSGGDGPVLIQAVLPRKTAFIRKAAGTVTDDQVVAANIDMVFVVDALDRNFNLRRIERFLTLARVSGAAPVIILSKADLSDDAQARLDDVQTIAFGVPIHIISALTRLGMEQLAPYLQPGRTVALLGPSGVGKSTLTNELLGHQTQRTQAIRSWDDRGRHTTTGRHLLIRADGGMLIDTPGMRELALWYSDDGVESVCRDVEALAEACRFRDCQHASEPECAVRATIERGELDPGRLKNHAKMVRELRREESVDDMKARRRRKLDLQSRKPMKRRPGTG